MSSSDTPFAFGFETKPGPITGRTQTEINGDQRGADNADYGAYACRSAFDLPPSDELTCPACERTFRFHSKAQKFCDHACYSAFLRQQPIGPRFWAKVNKNGPVHPVLGTRCWLWTGALTGSGSVRHGQAKWRARYRTPQKAHRIAWELTHGPIPADQQANHHCDNPICCNVAHIYLGTQDDNMKDAAERGRLTVPRTRTLSLYDRLTIYRMPRYRGICIDLARQYGVTKTCISLTRRGRFLGSGEWNGTKSVRVADELAEAL